jgi:hypothetical protein
VPTYLLSPDIDASDSSGYSRDSGFYLLRKDSERRATLVHILTQDMDKVKIIIAITCTLLTRCCMHNNAHRVDLFYGHDRNKDQIKILCDIKTKALMMTTCKNM